MVYTLDPNLKDFATDKQWQYLLALQEYGSDRKAAAAVGVGKTSIVRARTAVALKAAKAGYSPEHDMVHRSAPGFAVKGTSTLYDEDGVVRSQWVKTDRDKEQQEAAMVAVLEGMAADLPKLPPRPAPKQKYNDQLMSVIPFGDPHFGMYAWAEEAGEDFDADIAKRDLCAAVDYLVSQSPSSRRCVILNLGDFFHADNTAGMTARSGNVLDMDTRLPRVIRIGVSAIRQAIESALTKHEVVEVICAIGNHDEVLSMALAIMLANVYENEPRVIIHDQPTPRHYIEHGKVLIGVTHGDRTKDRDLPGIMATEKPEAWGRTKQRYFYRGHLHHDTVETFNGCVVEQFSTLAPNDAWHNAGGYLTDRNMKLIVHHKDYGEVARSVCSIAMLRGLRLEK